MAWAMTHFLTGASIALLSSLIASVYIEGILEFRLFIVYLGGLFALVPDFGNLIGVVNPSYNELYRETIHDSVVSNIFFFHRFLDRDVFRTSQVKTLALVISVFTIILLLAQIRHFRS